MLASVNGDELAGDTGAVEEEPQRGGDVARVCAAAKDGGGALAGEVVLSLPRATQGGSGADAVDADVRGKPLGGGLGQRPEAHLGDGVGAELGRQFQDALVDHVHDQALGEGLSGFVGRARGALGGKALLTMKSLESGSALLSPGIIDVTGVADVSGVRAIAAAGRSDVRAGDSAVGAEGGLGFAVAIGGVMEDAAPAA